MKIYIFYHTILILTGSSIKSSLRAQLHDEVEYRELLACLLSYDLGENSDSST